MESKEKKVPHVRAVAISAESIKQLILSTLNWTEERYNDYQFEQGCTFLEVFTKDTKVSSYDVVSRSSLYWKWWKNQWNEVDKLLYEDSLMALNERVYYQCHSINIYQDEFLINSLYNNIGMMIDEVTIDTKGKELIS